MSAIQRAAASRDRGRRTRSSAAMSASSSAMPAAAVLCSRCVSDEVLARLADALRPGGVLLRAREGHGVGTAPGTSRVTATTGSDGSLRGRLNDAAHYIELAP